MIYLREEHLKIFVEDLGYPMTKELYKEIAYIHLYLYGHGITLNDNTHFLNIYGLEFQDEKQEFIFRLRYSHMIDPRFQKY